MNSTDPAMNPPSVNTIVDCPEPTANSVPDAHEPPSCMPIAKIAAPANSPRPIGLAVIFGVAPNNPMPVDAISAISVAAVPSNNECARTPWPLPTATSCRQAEVNPKRAWNSASPRNRPITSSAPNFAP